MRLFAPQTELWDMPMAAVKGMKHIPHFVGNVFYVVVGGSFKLAFRWKVEHKERLSRFAGKQGVVLVANHTSYLDPLFFLVGARPKQWVRFIGREDLFTKKGGLSGEFLSRMGAFPIKRDTADRTALKRSVKMLKRGEVVGIFPEATRRGKSERAPKIHAGAALIAQMAGAPIVPAAIVGADQIKKKGSRMRFHKVRMTIGEAIWPADFADVPKPERLDAISWYAMREVFALRDRIDPSEVDMRALFPDSPDFTDYFAEHPVVHRDPAESDASVSEKAQVTAEPEAKAASGGPKPESESEDAKA